jgi:hypothetical protein
VQVNGATVYEGAAGDTLDVPIVIAGQQVKAG